LPLHSVTGAVITWCSSKKKNIFLFASLGQFKGVNKIISVKNDGVGASSPTKTNGVIASTKATSAG
jgi:hypothetical protein